MREVFGGGLYTFEGEVIKGSENKEE